MAGAVGTASLKQGEPAGVGSPVKDHAMEISAVRTEMVSTQDQDLGPDEI